MSNIPHGAWGLAILDRQKDDVVMLDEVKCDVCGAAGALDTFVPNAEGARHTLRPICTDPGCLEVAKTEAALAGPKPAVRVYPAPIGSEAPLCGTCHDSGVIEPMPFEAPGATIPCPYCGGVRRTHEQ